MRAIVATLCAALPCAGFLVAGCADRAPGERPAIAVTADWLNRSLTVLSQEALTRGGSLEDAILGAVDLAAWPPGPIEAEITPDGRTAVVAVGPGFFQSGITNALVGSPDVPNGSALLLVDLEALAVTAELHTRHAPLGIAITPDGRRAYTANYGMRGEPGDSVSVIDLDTKRVVDEFSVGGRPEQIAIDPEGRFAVVNLVGDGGVRLFELADPSGTLGAVVPTGNDPSGSAFLEGGTRLVVANSQSTDLTLIDTSSPGAARAVQQVALAAVPYGVSVLADGRILAPTGVPTTLVVLELVQDRLIAAPPIPVDGQPFPMIAAADESASFAFVPHMSTQGDAQLSIVDLEAGTTRGVRWLPASGPSYVATWP